MSLATLERPLTPQQRAALEARDRSVSLAAGAGCGKTFVLTERFLSHVDPTQADAAQLDELVAITFTDAAAREMRDRIRRRCFERLQRAATDDEAAAWQRLLRSMDAARISTIHSFCAQLLRTYAVEAGLDAQFEVLDAAAAQLLKLETIDDCLRKLLLAHDDDTLELAARRGLDRLRNDLAALAGPTAMEAIERWRDATPEDLVAHWQRFYDEQFVPEALRQLCAAPELVELRRLCGEASAKSDHLVARLRDLAARLDALPKSCPATCAEVIAAIRLQARVADIRGAKHWHNIDDYEPLKQACERVRTLLDKTALGQPLDFTAAQDAAAQGLALLRLTAVATESLAAIKAQRNQLEFDDLLAHTHRLLTDPAHAAIRQQIAQRTRLLMVDEFQDTNPLQANIIKAFCGDDWHERGLFAVGDFKQSIYRFTGAQPQVSTSLRAALTPAGRLSLTRNFRSQPAITDFVNALFYDEFEEYEPLAPARPQMTPTPAVEFLWTPLQEESDAQESAASVGADGEATGGKTQGGATKRRRAGAARDARVTEARWMARRLVQLLQSEQPLVVGVHEGQPAPRRLQLGDIAILLRTLSDAQVYEEALREHGLDYYLHGGHAFYSQQEIYDVLNLLRAIASPVDEIALAGALRSPIFSLQDETLFWLVNASASLNGALAAQQRGGKAGARVLSALSADEAAKVRRAAAVLVRLREAKDRLLVADLLTLALDLTGYDAIVLAEFLGPRKAANVEKLVEQARALDRSSPGDLQGYITQLSEFVLRAPKEALAATQTEGDVIRIMTIHHAKGLEFPLVVLPDLDRRRHGGSSQPVLDLELGPLMPTDAEEDQSACSGHRLYRYIENRAELEERKRLLYVACTRAADYLLLSSSIEDPAAPQRDWLQLLARHVSLVDGALQRPLPPGYAAPDIWVTTDLPRIDETAPSAPRGADLGRLVLKTRELATNGAGGTPPESDPVRPDMRARRQFSFSQLSGQLALERPTVLNAADKERSTVERPSDRGELGSLVHAVLERINLQRQDDLADLCEFLAPECAPSSPGTIAADAAAIVARFLRSPRGAELAAAPIVRREVEFLLPWALDSHANAGRYLHGYIDCLYQDQQGHWRLLDYKTNHVTPEGVAKLAERYQLQALVYWLACERS
ncbi:MAG: UvrD-helicase domain-containing protein, partial [Pirellulales bacterium]|nr:UvrD-helicase domain-containing protein [Pirellulales bacterium]